MVTPVAGPAGVSDGFALAAAGLAAAIGDGEDADDGGVAAVVLLAAGLVFEHPRARAAAITNRIANVEELFFDIRITSPVIYSGE
jgi:hypothetical protein